MKVRFQYADGSVWEGPPEDAHLSPDPRPKEPGWVYEPNDQGWGGIIRMVAVDNFGREITFAYRDFYYLVAVEDGAFEFGSGADSVKLVMHPNQDGHSMTPVTFEIPTGAVLRVGVTVDQEDAVKFGLIGTVDEKQLHPKIDITIRTA